MTIFIGPDLLFFVFYTNLFVNFLHFSSHSFWLVLQQEKKMMAEEEEKDNAVRLRTNLSIPLLPEKEEDKKIAALLKLQAPECKHDQTKALTWTYCPLRIICNV